MSVTDDVTSLFVYGTLKRGQMNWELIAPYAVSVERASISGALYDVGLFPALVRGEGTVWGEVVRLSPARVPAILALLDRLEGYMPEDEAASMYLRRIVTATSEDGGEERAYAYFYAYDLVGLRRLETSEWTGSSTGGDLVLDPRLGAFEEHVRRFLQDEESH